MDISEETIWLPNLSTSQICWERTCDFFRHLIMKLTPRLFKSYASRNISNPRLRKTYRFATHHALEKRLQVVHEVPEWEALRDRAHTIKEQTIGQLDHYLEKL